MIALGKKIKQSLLLIFWYYVFFFSMFTKKENDDSNNPIYDVNKNISIVDCKKSQSNNTKMVKDKIKNPNVHQSNYINDNIEQSESGINGNSIILFLFILIKFSNK